MKTIPLSSIVIGPDRQRKNFTEKEQQELVESIKAKGLFHPVVLRWEGTFTFEPGDGSFSPGSRGRWILVSGERRIRAATDIYALGGSFKHDNQLVPEGEIPWVDIGELDELAREEAEFDENHQRVNLTWQEEAAAVQRLAAARAKHGGVPILAPLVIREVAAKNFDLPEGTGTTREDKGLGYYQEQTRRQVIVAQNLHIPEVKDAKDVNDAFKILKKKEETERRVVLATEVGKTYTSDVHTLLQCDSLTWMAEAAIDQLDVICTDPIYGIGADEFGDSGGKAHGAHFYKDDYETWQKHVEVLANRGFQLAKKQAHLYAFCDITRFEEFKGRLAAAGWDCFRTPIIWHKPNGSRTPWVDGGPQRKYEIILYARKGKKPVTRIYPDLVSYPADENLGHPAQKPVALFIDLLRRSVAPGDRILDPFAGSGAILPAGHALQVKVTALEIDAAAYAIGVERLKKLKEQLELEGL